MTQSGRIVVTGAAGALGSALVRALRADGQRVAALVLEADLERMRSELDPERDIAIAADVRSPEDWARALEQFDAPTGAVLVAGAWRGGMSDDAWRAMMDANLETARRSIDALLPGMVARKNGSIVLVGSRAAVRPWESGSAPAYAASKAAVVALAGAVAADVLESGVRVNVVLPSTIDTPANRRAMPDADATRWVAADSLAGVIAFLLSPASRDISGAAIPVYGRA